MKINNLIKIGDKLRAIRVKVGLTQGDLASMVGIPRTTYANYESNRRGIDIETLEKILDCLEISIDNFFEQKSKEISYNELATLFNKSSHKDNTSPTWETNINNIYASELKDHIDKLSKLKPRFDKIKPLIDYIEPLGYEIDMFGDNGFLELTFEKNTYLVSEEEFTELFKSVNNIIDLSIQGLIKNSKKKPKQK